MLFTDFLVGPTYRFAKTCIWFSAFGLADVVLCIVCRVKLSHIEHVFVTHGSWENIGGLTGELLFLYFSTAYVITNSANST